MDTLWISATVIAVTAAVAIAIRIAMKPRRFKPKGDAYWKEKARAIQKRHTGQVISGSAPLTKDRSRPRATNDR
ncbi:hypothetical protein [Azotobacter chroococcum]|uniref:hypothetical protein n=1 Tax=Azotobacter chroococcum TaxID=353 RepID=UPI0010AE198C|nr:hypothetical protein [Azotobacter chroococcum]TKD32610.1 hypothetical protein FCG41_22035 [Azotobacter chroococcum]